MKRIASRLRLVFLAGLSCAALLAPLHAAAQRAVEVDRIVAVVNDEVITTLELRERLEQAKGQLARQGTALPPEDLLERQLLERLVLERAQIQLARETALAVDDATLERAVERIAENNKLTISDLRQALEEDGITWKRFRDNVRTEILLSRLREREVDSRIVVTEAEIENFLANNPDALSGEEYLLAHILLRVPDGATSEQFSRVVERAEELMRLLAEGEDFGRLAATYSDAPDAINGGEIGWRTRDRMPPLFAEAVRDMRPGQVSEVMRSAAGLHLVKLLDQRGGIADGRDRLEQTRARHILVRTSEVLSDSEAEARLLGLRERILNGADFAELARAHSADLSAAKGGDLGWIYPGDTVPEFERAMNALQPGEVSQPVRSPFGWHLIQVEDRRVQDVSDERKRAAVRNALRERKADEAFEDWLRQLRDRTYVEYRLERD